MTPFIVLPALTRALVVSLFYLLLAGFLFCAMVQCLQRRRLRRTDGPVLFIALALLCSLYCLQSAHLATATQWPPSPMVRAVATWPWAAHAALGGIAAGTLAFHIQRIIRLSQTTITASSIREALDNLPAGLCFSDGDGVPLLTNRRMYELAAEISGHVFRHVTEFWQELRVWDQKDLIRHGVDANDAIARLSNGTSWRFSQRELCIDGVMFLQTTATNITPLYHMTQQLAARNADLRAQHQRLRQLATDLVHIKREEEILATKIKIHSELGRCLLASRYYLARAAADLAPVLVLWEEVVTRLETSAATTDYHTSDILDELIDIAALLNCTVEVKGGWPNNEDAARLLLTALREAVLNAVRHSNANHVAMTIQAGERLVAVISDNGDACPEEIMEGSGLSALRRQIESHGGQFKIACENGVRLHLQLP